MFSHVMVGSADIERSRRFYDAVLGTLGVQPGMVDRHRVFWRSPGGTFGVTTPINGQPPSVANGATLGFVCTSPEQVKAWHDAGVAHGGTSCEDPPGVRERPTGSMYLAYLRDPDGHKLCATYRFPKP